MKIEKWELCKLKDHLTAERIEAFRTVQEAVERREKIIEEGEDVKDLVVMRVE